MTLRQCGIAIIGSALLIGTAMLSGDARSTDEASIAVAVRESGPFSVTIAESSTSSFNDVTYSFDDQHSTGELIVFVLDRRGTASGWQVAFGATDFRGTSGTIPVYNLSLSAGAISHKQGNTDTSGQRQFDIGSASAAGTLLWTADAGFGDGGYELELNGNLSVPGGTLVGSYTSTVTVTLTGNTP